VIARRAVGSVLRQEFFRPRPLSAGEPGVASARLGLPLRSFSADGDWAASGLWPGDTGVPDGGSRWAVPAVTRWSSGSHVLRRHGLLPFGGTELVADDREREVERFRGHLLEVLVRCVAVRRMWIQLLHARTDRTPASWPCRHCRRR
jgi:hypothetical protein